MMAFDLHLFVNGKAYFYTFAIGTIEDELCLSKCSEVGIRNAIWLPI